MIVEWPTGGGLRRDRSNRRRIGATDCESRGILQGQSLRIVPELFHGQFDRYRSGSAPQRLGSGPPGESGIGTAFPPVAKAVSSVVLGTPSCGEVGLLPEGAIAREVLVKT